METPGTDWATSAVIVPEQANVPYIKISTCDERTREMYRYAHHVAQIIIVVVTGVPPELAGPEAYEGVGISI